MTVSRRRLFWSVVLTGTAVEGQSPDDTLEALRSVSVAHGVPLSDARLRVMKPVLDNRRAQLQTVRDFEIDDAVEPTHGNL